MTLEFCQQIIVLHGEIVGKDTIYIVLKEPPFVLLVIFIDRIDELTTFSDVSVFKPGNLVPAYSGVAAIWRKDLQFDIRDGDSRAVA